MTCRELLEALADFVAEELAPERRPDFDGHLGRCPSCGALVDSYRFVITLARSLPPLPLPDGLAERVRVVLVREWGASPGGA